MNQATHTSASSPIDIPAELQRLRDEVQALKAGFRDMVTDAARLCANVLKFKQALADAHSLSERAQKGGMDAESKEATRITEALWKAIETDAIEVQGRIGAIPEDLLALTRDELAIQAANELGKQGAGSSLRRLSA